MIAFLDLIDNEEDRVRFMELYDTYKGLMLAAAEDKCPNELDAEDVVQDAFLYIAKNFDKVGDIHSPMTKRFVAVITEGMAIDKFRKDFNTLSEVSMDDPDNDIEVFTEDIPQSEIKMIVDSLREDYRNIIYLSAIFGYTSQEIAEVYGITDSAVRKRLEFAREEIRYKLKQKK